MNRFAELLDRLAYEPGRNNKLRLLEAYFREVGDPDRGYALAALTGALSFKHAKPGLIRDLITDRADPVLFGLSYDYVGDLSETVALMWPKAATPIAHNNPPPPTLTEVVTTLRTLGKTELPQAARALARRTGRDRPLGAAKTRHRRDADRHLGAARKDRGGRARRQGSARGRADLARADAALHRAVRLARGPRRQAGQSRSRAVPSRDAGACDRGHGFRRSRCRRLHRRMEMGRHPRAGGRGPRRARHICRCGSIRAPARTSPRAFRTSCRRCICPAPSTASCWWCATAACRVSTCCSSG